MIRVSRFLMTVLLSFSVCILQADNVSVGKVQISAGKNSTVGIKLTNKSYQYVAFQFDMQLPKGISIAKDKNGTLKASLNSKRISDHVLHVAEIKSQTYRFLAYSKTNSVISGKEGVLVNLTIKADKDYTSDSEKAKIISPIFVEATAVSHDISNVSFNIEAATEPIIIGDYGKLSYCGDKSLDFSFSDEVKAYVATGYESSNGTIWLTRIKQVPAGTPIIIKGEVNKTYEVPILDKCVAFFENMFKGSTDKDQTISTTTADGKYKNYYMSKGLFKPAAKSQTIKAGKCYLQVPAKFKAAKAGSKQKVKIADSGKSSYAPPVDVDLTNVEGLKAYAATGYDATTSTIWLTRINKIQAGEGVMLKGEGGKTYTLPSTEVQAYYGNMIVGNTGNKITINETSDDGEWTNFYLANGSFKKVSDPREIGTNKSYLHLPTSLLVSSARGKENAGTEDWFMEELETETLLLGSIGGDDEDGTTRIDAIGNDNFLPDTYYNLQGQRVDNPKKGLYIKNGKKVVIRSTTK